uniref:phosphate/phosphite/phosphonate ABC transporter substrate-binding protein n=1 Tax=Pararhizobium sp. IMCC3301 TaxID=3067904 RepID=UPI002740AC7D|nr:PhnD/SsuA/transferrin family substrate-binding protein [Pararhizobium sp. IMCC3301]
MIASLTMYQRPQLASAHDNYWALIRQHLAAAGMDSPPVLAQQADDMSVWTDPGLVLSQTCGLPYRTELHHRVSLIGTPDFAVEGCAPGYYRSAIVVRKSERRTRIAEFRDAVFAYNQTGSQSGYAAPYWHVKARGFWFENRQATGGHLNSARAVAEGRADLAALDAVSWRLMQEYEPLSGELKVLDWTTPTPGLPYISAANANHLAIFQAVRQAVQDLSEEDRSALGLRDLVCIDKQTYLAVPTP